MLLRLTYEGILLGASRGDPRARHKHELRKCFHRQFKRFWDIHPDLKQSAVQDAKNPSQHYILPHYLAEKFARYGYNFVPLVTEEWSLSCSINVLMLRPDMPGTVIKSGDLDNRLKTIFDALRMPSSKDELGGCDVPTEDEKPFYCLLEDDKLVTNVTVEADVLLETVSDPPNQNDTRLVIRIDLKPQRGTMIGLLFI